MSIRKLLESLTPRAVLEYNSEITLQKYGHKLIEIAQEDISSELDELDKYSIHDPQGKARFAQGLLRLIERADPTPHKEYTVWLTRTYANQDTPYIPYMIEDLYSKVKPALQKFALLKLHQKLLPEHKDILKIKTFDNLIAVMETYADTEIAEVSVDRGRYEEIFSNDQVRIIQPQDETAAIYFGQGTRWCTAATKGYNYFNRYHKDGPLFILLPKKPAYTGEKYQIHFATGSYMDEEDRPVNFYQILTARFGDLTPLFKKLIPSLNDWIFFSDETVLNNIIPKIMAAVEEILEVIMVDWQDHDEEWMKELLRRGYALPPTNRKRTLRETVDWARVNDDDLDWFGWNDNADTYYQSVVSITQGDIDELRNSILSMTEESMSSQAVTVADLPSLIGDLLHYNLIEDVYDQYNINDWVSTHIKVVRNKAGKWTVLVLGDPPSDEDN